MSSDFPENETPLEEPTLDASNFAEAPDTGFEMMRYAPIEESWTVKQELTHVAGLAAEEALQSLTRNEYATVLAVTHNGMWAERLKLPAGLRIEDSTPEIARRVSLTTCQSVAVVDIADADASDHRLVSIMCQTVYSPDAGKQAEVMHFETIVSHSGGTLVLSPLAVVAADV